MKPAGKSIAVAFENVPRLSTGATRRYRPLVFRRAAARRTPAFDHLRAFVIGLVVWHHAMMAYCGGGEVATGGAFMDSSAPIVDPAQWSGFNQLVLLNDSFFMPLMFLLSGLFVRPSLARKGLPTYLGARTRRLGVPLLAGVTVIIPLAYYASYLQAGGTSGFGTFWLHMVTRGPWPSGPMWFVGVLLVFDTIAASLLATRETKPARKHRPWISGGGLLLALVILSALVYLPAVAAFGEADWLNAGPFAVQTSRIGLYALYFAVGVIVGADRMASAFRSHWLRWPLLMAAMIGAFFAIHDPQLFDADAMPKASHDLLMGAFMLLFSAAMAAGLLTLALHLGDKRSVIGESLGANAYGIYLLHYPIVLWLQYELLKLQQLDAIQKGVLVLVVGFGLSWLVSSALRQLPGVRCYV